MCGVCRYRIYRLQMFNFLLANTPNTSIKKIDGVISLGKNEENRGTNVNNKLLPASK